MQYSVNLTAGQSFRQHTTGSYFLIKDDAGAGAVIDVKFRDHTSVLEEISTAKRGTKARLHKGQFTSVDLTADRNCTLEIIISDGLIDVDYMNGANVNATIAGPHTGTVADPINVVGVTINDAPCATCANAGPTAVGGGAAVQLLPASANRRGARFANLGTDPMTIGAAGITWAARVIVVYPGDTWVEERAANLAWYAITDVGKSASATTQEVVS